VSLRYNGGVAFNTTGRGADVYDNDASGVPSISLRNSQGANAVVGTLLATATQTILRGGVGTSMNLQQNNNENVLTAIVNGNVSLHRTGAIKISTTNYGAEIRGFTDGETRVDITDENGSSRARISSATNGELFMRNLVNGARMSWQGFNASGVNKQLMLAIPGAQCALYGDGVTMVRTATDAAEQLLNNSGGFTVDALGTNRPIGFNQLPRRDITGTSTATTADIGKRLRHPDTSACVINLFSAREGDAIVLQNAAGAGVVGTMTVNAGELRWATGSDVRVATSRTISNGGMATVVCEGGNVWMIYGSGIS
jgi:hypothetical protein